MTIRSALRPVAAGLAPQGTIVSQGCAAGPKPRKISEAHTKGLDFSSISAKIHNMKAKARLYLARDMNCALATIRAIQDIAGIKDDRILASATGLEGGVVASGSTCGVITGGALGMAMMFDESGGGGGAFDDAVILESVGEYVDWFYENFNTTSCRGRSGVDFYKTSGQIRYFIPGDRLTRCLNHIGKAVEFLISHARGMALSKKHLKFDELVSPEPRHCATEVLSLVAKKTGNIDPSLIRASVVLDGGVGLKGGVCGALSGAIMAMNSKFGMNPRKNLYIENVGAFAVGHINLLIERPIFMPEPFGIGREIVSRFRKRSRSLECRDITGRDFDYFSDFQSFMSRSEKCSDLIDFSAGLAINAIEEWGGAS